jgi:hypothetical protein
LIWVELIEYVSIRQNSRHASLRTVLIDSLPNDCNTKNQLEDTLAVFPGALQAITINRDYSSLSRRVREQEDLVRRLEAAETQFVRTVLRGRVNKLARQTTAKKALLSRNKSGLHHFMARLTSRKVDKIASYKKQLGKLTEEINKQRASREDFPRLPSVFVTFQDPIAAHMVCQTVIHPRYGYITPRTLPISLDDVVWDNICIGWWQRSVRMVVSNTLAVLLALLCALPAAFAGLLSQIIYLTHAVPWLAWVGRLPHWTLGLIQGVLPPLFLTTLVRIFSWSLEYLVQAQGIPSYSLISLKIQDLYFYFLFVQITLLVSLSAGLTAIVNEIASGGFVAATLAKNLPKASNYFLSYVLLQALSVSANALLRVDRLVDKVILGPLLDKTVTELLERQHGRDIEWGTFVPVYTNLACIGIAHPQLLRKEMTNSNAKGLLYAIISPIILPFQTIAFTLFFVIYSYSGILTTKRDSGGLFYPTALKQLILGVYLMEISLATLFLLVRDSQGRPGCIPQAGLMIVAFALTTVYHHLLCKAFNPLLFYTPTSLQLPAIHPAEATFEHQALTSVPTLRLPEDDSGVSSNETNKLRTDVREIIVSNRQATISTSGHIQLRADSGGFI